MTGLRQVPISDLPARLVARAAASEEATGDSRFLQVLGNAPHMAEFYFGEFYDKVFFGGTVPITTKELIRLRLSTLHGCVY